MNIDELRKKVNKTEETAIIDSFVKGLSRDKTATIVRKNKNIVQEYFNWLSLSKDYSEQRAKNKSQFTREKSSLSKNEQFENFRDYYLQGASVDYLKFNLHLSSTKVQQYIKSLPDNERQMHYDNLKDFNIKANIERAKEIQRQYEIKYISDFFGRDVKTRAWDVYGRIDFITAPFIFAYLPDGTVNEDEGHFASTITPHIQSRDDFFRFLDIIEKHRDNIDPTFVPYIKDFKHNIIYSIPEFARKLNVSLE